MIVPDHIGCGLSDKPDDSRYDYTLASRVDDLEALLDHLGLDRELTLVLHDWGGIIGMAFAARHPGADRPAGRLQHGGVPQAGGKVVPLAALGSSATRRRRLAGPRPEPVRPRARPGSAARRDRCRAMSATPTPRPTTPGPTGSPSTASSRTSRSGPATAATTLISRVQDRLALLAIVPMLIAWGMKDFVFDEPFLDEWVRRFPAAEVHRFPRAGHLLFEDERRGRQSPGAVVPVGPSPGPGGRRLSRADTLTDDRRTSPPASPRWRGRHPYAWPSSSRRPRRDRPRASATPTDAISQLDRDQRRDRRWACERSASRRARGPC